MTEHVRLDDVVSFLNERLEVSKFDEEESNGLIVRASDVVTRTVIDPKRSAPGKLAKDRRWKSFAA